MRLRRSVVLLAALAAAPTGLAGAQADLPLRVVRTTPAGDAGPLTEISVTFDRPVAGSLDQTVDPARILSIAPAVRGRLEWRDPVTIRLTPSTPFAAGTPYTGTRPQGLRAMDGGRLAAPYSFSLRARGPTLLTGSPVSGAGRQRHITPNQRFDVVYSAPVDLAILSRAAFLEFAATCGGDRIVRLTALGQRR